MSFSSPFLTHLSFFAVRSSGVQTRPNIVTIGSSLKSSLAIGLDFPVACLLAIGLRLLYGNPSSLYLSAVNIDNIPQSKLRYQLEDVNLDQKPNENFTLSEVSSWAKTKSLVNQAHIANLWTFAADTKTGLVSKRDIQAFQKGTWLWDLEKRRKSRQDVLPLWRGGPIS